MVQVSQFFFMILFETNDLIYEGIATGTPPTHIPTQRLGNKRPDLRRDCDPDCTAGHFFSPDSGETNDLIYEGIATGSVSGDNLQNLIFLVKQTT